MNAFIILAHPEPNSFNGKLAKQSREELEAQGYSVQVSDLYAMDFDAREGAHHFGDRVDPQHFHAQSEQRHSAKNQTLPAAIVAESDKLLWADLVVVHFPFWWFGAPAILKGWMDRAFVYGKIYKSQLRYDAGVCRGKKFIACVTTGASADSCSHNGREGDTKLLLWPLLFPFRYIGFDVYAPEIFHGVGGVASIEKHEDGKSDLEKYEETWKLTLQNLATRPLVPFNADTDFGDDKKLKPNTAEYSPFVAHKSSPLY